MCDECCTLKDSVINDQMSAGGEGGGVFSVYSKQN